MFENLMSFFKKLAKKENKNVNSKEQAKERLHLVLMQDRANVSADFLDLMKQEIIDVIKKYIEVDESAIDVRLTNKDNGDGTTGAPALYANIPITKIKEDLKEKNTDENVENKSEKSQESNKKEEEKEEDKKEEKAKKEEIKDKNDENETNNKDKIDEKQTNNKDKNIEKRVN